MYNPATDLAARRALISSGIVGLTTAILTKTMDVQVEVSLPVGVATAIALDFMVNRETDEAALQIAKTAIGDFIQNELAGTPASGTKYEEQLLTGVTALLGGATIEIGRYMVFGGGPTGYAVAAAGRVGTAIAGTAVPELGLPVLPDLISGLENVPGRLAGFAAAGWGIYSRNQLSRDLARFGMFLYDQFQRAPEENYGDPNAVGNLQVWADQHAADYLAERPASIVVPSDATSIRDLVDELPGVPSVDGRLTLFQREDGSEVALAWDHDGAPVREVPVVRLGRDTLSRVSRSVSSAPTYSDEARSHTPSDGSLSTDPSEQRLVHRATFYGLSMNNLETYLTLGAPMFQKLTTMDREGVTYTVMGFEPTGVTFADVYLWNPDPEADGHMFKFEDVDLKNTSTMPGGQPGPRPLLEVTGEELHHGDRVWWNVQTLMTPEEQFGEEVGILIAKSDDGVISVVGMNGDSDDPSERSFMITLSYFLTAQEDPRRDVVSLSRD